MGPQSDLPCFSRSNKRILSTISERQPEPELCTFSQFAKVDMGFLAWHFQLLGDQEEEVAFIARAFRGFGREVNKLCRIFLPVQ